MLPSDRLRPVAHANWAAMHPRVNLGVFVCDAGPENRASAPKASTPLRRWPSARLKPGERVGVHRSRPNDKSRARLPFRAHPFGQHIREGL